MAFEYAPAPESRSVVSIASSYGLFINGEFATPTKSDGPTYFDTISPGTGESLGKVIDGSVADVAHALAFVNEAHAQPQGGYAWVLDWHESKAAVTDGTNHCYGLAFVLLACAHALKAGVAEAAEGLAATFALMEQRFWEPAHGLYADEATPDWLLGPYRGQNANMHACEAMLAAHAATGEARYLDRALTLATSIAQRQAALAGGLVWEHYQTDWTPDWDYNRDDKTNIFRPWGYQPGHLTEWAKLLLILERHSGQLQHGDGWLLPAEGQLFAILFDNVGQTPIFVIFNGVPLSME